MGVTVQFKAPVGPRQAPASINLVRSPTKAFGNWAHRVKALYGQVLTPSPGPETSALIPVLGGQSLFTPESAYTWSVVSPALPRVLPRQIPHNIPLLNITPAVRQLNGANIINQYPRVPRAASRVTTTPAPSFIWPVQGGKR